MGVKEEVLRTLRSEPDAYISGQALADRLSVSRHAVWKAIDKLRSEGYDIDARTNCGYRLVAADDSLSAEGVAAFLPQASPFKLEYHAVIDSTNIRARTLAEAGAPEWTVVLADSQTAGRGRLGRAFYSPQASGIYMSAIVRPDCDVREANLLTIAAAAAVAESIEAICGKTVGIKWVNDCFVEQRKVSGILTEAAVGVEEQHQCGTTGRRFSRGIGKHRSQHLYRAAHKRSAQSIGGRGAAAVPSVCRRSAGTGVF